MLCLDASRRRRYSHNGERLGTYNGHNGTIWSVAVDCECLSSMLCLGESATVWRTGETRLEESLRVDIGEVERATLLSVILARHALSLLRLGSVGDGTPIEDSWGFSTLQ